MTEVRLQCRAKNDEADIDDKACCKNQPEWRTGFDKRQGSQLCRAGIHDQCHKGGHAFGQTRLDHRNTRDKPPGPYRHKWHKRITQTTHKSLTLHIVNAQLIAHSVGHFCTCVVSPQGPAIPDIVRGNALVQSAINFQEITMSMSDRDGFIWYDGKLVPWRDANTHVLTHSLHYGLAVFEGLRAYQSELGTAIFRLQDHTDRLFNSAHIYQIPMPFDKDTINAAHIDAVRSNELDSCYIRPLVFYGSEKMGVSPKGATVHVAIAAWSWGAYLGEEALKQGIRVKISSFARQHVNVTMPRAKVASTYANSIIANAEAAEHGYDEALLLDTDGFVAEGAGENLFIVKNGVLYEPEIASALTGITRSTVHALAADLNIPVKTTRLTREIGRAHV